MKDRKVQYSKSLNSYLRVKKLQIFSVLKRLNFSGQLIWTDSQKHQWTLFINYGQVVYGTGGIHPVRQWYRHVQAQLSQKDLSYPTLQRTMVALPDPILPGCWDYQLLHHWLDLGVLSRKTFQHICQEILADVLFDIVHADNARYELVRHAPLPYQLMPVISEEDLLTSVQKLWEDWFRSDVKQYSPNLAPVIKHPEPIQAEVSPRVFESLMQLLDGQRSLRDLSVKLKQDVLNLTHALYPYIKADWIALKPIADFPPILVEEGDRDSSATDSSPCIACIDDSLMVCKSMEQIIRAVGYEFLSTTEGAKAVPLLLAKKPDLIFLDLVMPDTNGYEICSQLRKISRFKETPIIILSGNDGLVDQVRARLLGASDFISKPIEPIIILAVIQKYLGQLVHI